ncbi:DNA-binding transcriptional MerR regulator [Deinococcus metalli]|uniref:DNA-binding transcriptional MerR regulator n=1 Tax=Deinococcus metalli TaxID=1141878 RepID=A0A7W8KLC4_9DEIO|nr:DNA-binding transcriptional MerR regulator [Deinococcus metalli]
MLRYYDQLGLFSPEQTDPQTGYRAYSATQLPRLNRILAARELGFSLEQIARLLDQNLSTDELRGMLTLRKAQIERAALAEAERLRVVESRLRQIEDEGTPFVPDVVLKSVPAQPFLSLREVFPAISAVRPLIQAMHAAVPRMVGRSVLGHVALVIHSPAFEPEALDFEVGYLLAGPAQDAVQLEGGRVLTVSTLPAIETAATLVHLGPSSDTHRSYGQLAGWLETQGWQVLGPGRQIMMQLPLDSPDAEAVVELHLPVQRPAQGT